MNELLSNLDKIHTTKLGMERIKNNLKLDNVDVIGYCKEKILDKYCVITKQGKNWYCIINDIIITINVNSYTVITAHLIRR